MRHIKRQHTGCNRLLQVFNGLFLAVEAGALLMVKPSQLLKDLGMVGVTLNHARVS